MTELALVAAAAAIGWYWYSSLRAREQAAQAAAEACRRQNLQFLDDTVALQRLALTRDHYGHLALRRSYRFEYSQIGNDRQQGFIIVVGARVETVGLAP